MMGSFSLVHLLVFAIILLPLTFLPSIIAAARRHPKVLWIFLLNLFLGWTGIGWIGALVWSVLPITRTEAEIR
jgi:hypothetical protein